MAAACQEQVHHWCGAGVTLFVVVDTSHSPHVSCFRYLCSNGMLRAEGTLDIQPGLHECCAVLSGLVGSCMCVCVCVRVCVNVDCSPST